MTKTTVFNYKRLVVPARFKVVDGREMLVTMGTMGGSIWNSRDQESLNAISYLTNPVGMKIRVVGFRPTWRA